MELANAVACEPRGTMHIPNLHLSKRDNKQSFCSICCFRCHLFLCVYLARCHVEQHRVAKPSGSSGSRGTCREDVVFSCHSTLWGTAGRPKPEGLEEPSELAPGAGLVLGRSHICDRWIFYFMQGMYQRVLQNVAICLQTPRCDLDLH